MHRELTAWCLMAGLSLVLAAPAAVRAADAPDARVTVQTDQPGVKISPLLYGIFFEEINRAGDGGLYAEMLQNRSFEDAKTPIGWTLLKGADAEASIALDASKPLNASNPTCLKLHIVKAGDRVAVCNEGFKGIRYGRNDEPKGLYERFQKAAASQTCGLFVEKDKEYRLSLCCCGDGYSDALTATIETQDGTVLARQALEPAGADWKKFEVSLKPSATDTNARLVISASATGTLYFDMVSLFPAETFKGRPNGMRKDLAQLIADMHPAFVRFPGGCYVEGEVLSESFRWKRTIGDIAARPGHFNLWGYYSNDGMGYHEYLQFCEDVGAEPLFVINCGMAHKDHVPMDKMDEYVQDALDAIEYANGPADSQWGALRAKAGHPASFQLKLMEIGNENGGPIYNERYALFHDAIKKRYPEVKLIANLWDGAPTSRPVEILDEHYYATPDFFFDRSRQYDKYDRAKYRVYVGEYAVTQGSGDGNLVAAVGEAAFMTGMERNGDVVVMASYAPLFENRLWKGWNPNAIVFDSARAYGTPSYHVQAMFGANRADRNLPATVEVKPIPRSGMIGVGTWATQAEFKDIKVTKDGKTLLASDFTKGMEGWQLSGGKWEIRDGALCQVGPGDGVRALAGSPDWTDYTLTLKARKTGGAEGFLILFTNQHANEKYWWNIGGWGNTRHALELGGGPGPDVKGAIEKGRWYDIKVKIKGSEVRCHLDGKLVHEFQAPPTPSLFVGAGTSDKSCDLILKVVNGGSAPLKTRLLLQGVKRVEPQAEAIVLTGEAKAENSFPSPTNVVPRREVIEGIVPEFQREFPPCSVTILRIRQSEK